jgi:hypothetical protein
MWRTTAAALLLAPVAAHALTFAVTGTADEEDLTPGNAICASATPAFPCFFWRALPFPLSVLRTALRAFFASFARSAAGSAFTIVAPLASM